MSKDVINVDGQDVVVGADTAKAFRGVRWAMWSIVAFTAIAVILFVFFFLGASLDGKLETPSQIQNTNVR